MSFLPDHIEERLRREVERRDLVLLELRKRGHVNSSVIEVIVDSEQGVSLDELTELSRWISALLDEVEDAIPGRYRLEVSSGGLDRPLELEWQFRKNVGRLLKVTFEDEGGTIHTEIVRLLEALPDTLMVGPKKQPKKGDPQTLSIPMEKVRRAVVEPEF